MWLRLCRSKIGRERMRMRPRQRKGKLQTRECRHRLQRIPGRVIGVLTQKQAARDWTSQQLPSENGLEGPCQDGPHRRRYGTRRPLHPKPMQARIPTWSLVERRRGPLFSLCPHCARCEISPVMPARSALPNTHTNTHRGHTHRHASDRSGGLHRKCTEKGARQAAGKSCQSRALDSS